MAWVKDLFVAHDRDARVATNRKSYPYCALHTPKLGHPYPSAAPCRILGEAATDLLERTPNAARGSGTTPARGRQRRQDRSSEQLSRRWQEHTGRALRAADSARNARGVGPLRCPGDFACVGGGQRDTRRYVRASRRGRRVRHLARSASKITEFEVT